MVAVAPDLRTARAAACGLVAALTLAAPALAGGGTVTVKSAAIASPSETVAANAAGRTLYALSGETTHHLKCKSSECARFWPPLIAPSRSAHLHAAGAVHGALGLIRRPNGSWQVTLRGKPLYRYSGDSAGGQAGGEGVKSFGGTWHAVTAAVTAAPAPEPAMTPESSQPYAY